SLHVRRLLGTALVAIQGRAAPSVVASGLQARKGHRMSRLKAALAAAVVAAVAMPAGALGGGGFSIIVFGTTGGEKGLRTLYTSIEVSGSVTVDFHGDAAAGCAAKHLCDVSGSVRWNPSGSGSITAIGYRKHGQRYEEAFTAL